MRPPDEVDRPKRQQRQENPDMKIHHLAQHKTHGAVPLCGAAMFDELTTAAERVDCWECASILGIDLDASTPAEPAAPTITTEDRVALSTGDRAFNYYDHKPGTIGKLDAYPQPDTMRGQSSSTPIAEWSSYWFDFQHDDGSSTTLDGSRICSIAYAARRGWMVNA